MPSRNVIKQDVAGRYYHIYARGVDKRQIFSVPKDYTVFLSLLKRYLSKEPAKDRDGIIYPHLHGKLEILSYCLMPNHFHLFIYQDEVKAMQKLMRGVMTSYSKYFNKRYNRRGPLFESRYKAVLVSNQSYLEHISRYIHLNPKDWQNYPYSSLPYLLGELSAEWIVSGKVSDLFSSKKEYINFLKDYQGHKRMLGEIKSDLADH